MSAFSIILHQKCNRILWAVPKWIIIYHKSRNTVFRIVQIKKKLLLALASDLKIPSEANEIGKRNRSHMHSWIMNGEAKWPIDIFFFFS